MSAPQSPRTEAILEAVRRRGHGDVASIVDDLDHSPPDEKWSALTQADRSATARRYLGRLVDAGEVSRLSEGSYLAVWSRFVETTDTTPGDTAATKPDRPPGNRTSTSPEAGHMSVTTVPDAASSVGTTADGDKPTTPARPAFTARLQRGPTDPDAGHNPEEGPTMTDPTSTDHEQDTIEDARPLRALLDECPHGPWPAAVYDRLEIVDQLGARKVELTTERDAALAGAQAAGGAESDAIVDGIDTPAHAAQVAQQRDAAAKLDRALATLACRLGSAALHVIDAQKHEVTARAHAARDAVQEHDKRRAALLGQLADLDGEHWRTIDQNVTDWRDKGRDFTLKCDAGRAGNLVAALRATLDDVPLGFPGLVVGWGVPAVDTQGLGTLAGRPGVPPIVELEVLRGDAAIEIEGAGDIVNQLGAELEQTPIR